MKLHCHWLLTFACLASSLHCAAQSIETSGVPVSYQLPTEGNLPRTFLVTLAITDPKNPDWIVSTFVGGQPRIVTAENKGKFTESWNGLDENFMPVPPGSYGVKGIFSPAKEWFGDSQWHAITPLFAGGISSWMPPAEPARPMPFNGDPVGSPLGDISVGPNGVAVFYYRYLENGKNCPMIDLNKPAGYDQVLRAFPSGGAAGGTSVATDGETVWAYCADSGPRYVCRYEGGDFGVSPEANRRNAYLPEGAVTSMSVCRALGTDKPIVFIAQRGKIITYLNEHKRKKSKESDTEFANKITVHDGTNGSILADLPANQPLAVKALPETLYVLQKAGAQWEVAKVTLKEGVPEGNLKQVFTLPAGTNPADLEVDGSGRFYVSDEAANKVLQLDPAGKLLRSFGRLAVQKPGSYDVETLMAPGKLAMRKDAGGKERLLILEMAGPNRVSEWDPESGKYLQEYTSYQTKSNDGFAVDPDDSSLIYLIGQRGWLVRWKVDYEQRKWTIDAVWPNVETGKNIGLVKPVAIRTNGTLFLASMKTMSVYRLTQDGSAWVEAAGVVEKDDKTYFWNDANENGEPDNEELRLWENPPRIRTYHGQRWLADLSYLAPEQGGTGVWRVSPDGFDSKGNPIFSKAQKLFVDPVFEAIAKGEADALHGGNELAKAYTSDWMQADGSMAEGFYVQARGGKSFTANFGSQHKVSRYVPDGKGGYSLKWRVGRTRVGRGSPPAQLQGGMRMFKPINGLVAIVDQSRSGLALYTEDGMFVDLVFPDSKYKDQAGLYSQPGEFFGGIVFTNAKNGKIYYGSGKYTPMLYEMQNWSLTENPVRPITQIQKSVAINSSQIASPPEIAVSLRGGAGVTSIARFAPALGGAALDGSIQGWESCEPVLFDANKEEKVEVRCLYDPENLYLRWHVRLANLFEPRPLPPLERIFTHDQEADTVGFYFQGNPQADRSVKGSTRDGDVRMIFGPFEKEGKVIPVGVAMYADWKGKNAAPQSYRSPVGEVSFAHVSQIPGVKLGYQLDEDKKGFVIAAGIPRGAIPALTQPFGDSLRTMLNFDANLGGHNKFWWADTDGSASTETYDEPSEARFYPGSWASADFQSLQNGVTIRNWMILGPFGGPGTESFKADPRNKSEVEAFFEKAVYPPDDGVVRVNEVYKGPAVEGYWSVGKTAGNVRWKTAEIEDRDTRVTLGKGSQAWYGATWIYSPADTKVELALQGHRMTHIRWSLNGEPIRVSDKEYADDDAFSRRSVVKEATLRRGWNQIFFRAYAVGYSAKSFRVGAVVRAPTETLWALRFSSDPKP